MATNAAMVLAKPAGMKPREIADRLAARLTDPRISAAEVAGPGFLNLRLSPVVWQGVIGRPCKAGTEFGRSDLGANAKSTSSSSAPTPPVRCMWAMSAARSSAMRWRGCCGVLRP